MTPQEKEKWVAALRSGEYKQGRGALRGGNQHGTKFCCLGVAEEVCNAPRGRDAGHLDEAWLSGKLQTELIILNDDQQLPFDRIADYIEANL